MEPFSLQEEDEEEEEEEEEMGGGGTGARAERGGKPDASKGDPTAIQKTAP